MKKIIILLFTLSSFLYPKGHYSSINKIAPLWNNNSIISIGKDEQIITWNLKNYEITRNIDFNRGSLTNISLMKEKGYIVLSNKEGKLFFVSLSTWTLIDIKDPNMGQLNAVYSLGNNLLLLIGKKGEVRVYNYNSDRIIKSITISEYLTASTIFDKKLYLANQTGNLLEIDLNSLKISQPLKKSFSNQINKILKTKDNLFFSTFDGSYYILRGEEALQIDTRENTYVTDFLSTSKGLLVAFSDGVIRLYKGKEITKEFNIKHKINTLYANEDIFVVGDNIGTMYFYSLNSLELESVSTDY